MTILQGIRDAVGPNTRVIYSRGADLVEGREEPRAAPLIEPAYLRPDAGSSQQGLKGEYFRGKELGGSPVLSRTDPRVAFRWDRGSPTDTMVAQGQLTQAAALGTDDYLVRWTGQLLPPTSGKYELVVGANDGFRLVLDGKTPDRRTGSSNQRVPSKSAIRSTSTRGKSYRHQARILRRHPRRRSAARLATAGRQAARSMRRSMRRERPDVVVFVGGLTGDVEGEEMNVSYPGFAGGDRTDLRLPQSQQKLLDALVATGKPVIMVITAGSAIAVDWATGQTTGDPHGVVPGPTRRQRRRRRAVRCLESGRPSAGHLLQGRRKAARLRGLQHEEPDLPVLRGPAALPVRAWPVVHEVRLLGPQARSDQSWPPTAASRRRSP